LTGKSKRRKVQREHWSDGWRNNTKQVIRKVKATCGLDLSGSGEGPGGLQVLVSLKLQEEPVEWGGCGRLYSLLHSVRVSSKSRCKPIFWSPQRLEGTRGRREGAKYYWLEKTKRVCSKSLFPFLYPLVLTASVV
jgi:hypothetical protein